MRNKGIYCTRRDGHTFRHLRTRSLDKVVLYLTPTIRGYAPFLAYVNKPVQKDPPIGLDMGLFINRNIYNRDIVYMVKVTNDTCSHYSNVKMVGKLCDGE